MTTPHYEGQIVRTRSPSLRCVLVGIATLAPVLACGDDPASPAGLPGCRTPVTVTVSSGSTPEFSWSPRCRVDMLRVESATTGLGQWTLFAAPFEDAISPGVRYGVAPDGAMELTQPPAPVLEAGTTYVLRLEVIAFPAPPQQVGRREFTP